MADNLLEDRLPITTQTDPAGHAAVARQPANEAVWLLAKRGKLALTPAHYTPPDENEIVIRNRAVAINPIDWLTQYIGQIDVFRTQVSLELLE